MGCNFMKKIIVIFALAALLMTYVFALSAFSSDNKDKNSSKSNTNEETKTENITQEKLKGYSQEEIFKIEVHKDENDVIYETMNYRFVNDERIANRTWETVDFVDFVDDFDPNHRKSEGNLIYLQNKFSDDGTVSMKFNTGETVNDMWTKGCIKFSNSKVISEYEIRTIDDIDYLFVQWKSGDYTIRHQTPSYYVFKKTMTDAELKEKYPNVLFGETSDTLLLDIEWHTYDSYKAEIADEYEKNMQEFFESDMFMNLSEKEQKERNTNYKSVKKYYSDNLRWIRNKRLYISKNINGEYFGNKMGIVSVGLYDGEDIYSVLDSNGYYSLNIYPFYVMGISYLDSDSNTYVSKNFTINGESLIYSESEYKYLLENEILSFCSDLLEKGLIAQEVYDMMTHPTPLDYYVDLYFKTEE